MRILFLYPETSLLMGDGRKTKHSNELMSPPLGLLYLSRCLEKEGHHIEVIDYSGEAFDYNVLKKKMLSSDIVGMTVLTPFLQNSIRLARIVKEIDPKIPLIIGGPHCSLYPKKSIEDLNADLCVEGEAELIISDIVKAFEGKKDFSQIPGVYYTDTDKIKKGLPHDFIKDIDEISFPSRNLVDKYPYGRAYIYNLKPGEFTSVLTTRGCPSKCKFCQRDFFSMKTFRKRSSENVIEELKQISDDGYKYTCFIDDNFLTNVERAHRIMDGIIKEGIDMKYYILGARVNAASKELFQKMKKAGVVWISFGIESGNQDVLNFYNKGITIDQIKNAVKLSTEAGFVTAGSFIFGAPIETKNHFEKTIKFAKSLPLDVVEFWRLKYGAGSQLWEDAVKEGKIDPYEYEVPSDSNRGLGKYPKEVLAHYYKKAYLNFYFRPSYFIDQAKKICKDKNFKFARTNFHFRF